MLGDIPKIIKAPACSMDRVKDSETKNLMRHTAKIIKRHTAPTIIPI